MGYKDILDSNTSLLNEWEREMAKDNGTQYQRASQYIKGIGENLDTIQNTDVLIKGYRVKERSIKGADKTFVELDIATLDDPENVVLFHAWSEPLAQKLDDIPAEAFPVIAKFTRVQTSNGFRVWTIE